MTTAAQTAKILAEYIKALGGSMLLSHIDRFYKAYPDLEHRIKGSKGQALPFIASQSWLFSIETAQDGCTKLVRVNKANRSPFTTSSYASKAAQVPWTASSNTTTRQGAASALVAHILQEGGAVLSCDIHKFHTERPDLQHHLKGSLKTFFQEFSHLFESSYVVVRLTPAALTLTAAAGTSHGVHCGRQDSKISTSQDAAHALVAHIERAGGAIRACDVHKFYTERPDLAHHCRTGQKGAFMAFLSACPHLFEVNGIGSGGHEMVRLKPAAAASATRAFKAPALYGSSAQMTATSPEVAAHALVAHIQRAGGALRAVSIALFYAEQPDLAHHMKGCLTAFLGKFSQLFELDKSGGPGYDIMRLTPAALAMTTHIAAARPTPPVPSALTAAATIVAASTAPPDSAAGCCATQPSTADTVAIDSWFDSDDNDSAHNAADGTGYYSDESAYYDAHAERSGILAVTTATTGAMAATSACDAATTIDDADGESASTARSDGELQAFLDVLHPELRVGILANTETCGTLRDVVLDVGAPLCAYCSQTDTPRVKVPEVTVTEKHLEFAISAIGADTFGSDNRAGLPGTLHRFSAMRNRKQQIIGLTMRVGRALPGVAAMIEDIAMMNKSILILGGPGSGAHALAVYILLVVV
jgi:hypothetical protein